MRVAVVGSGIAGVACAHRLQDMAERVVVFEAQGRIGGHTDTHDLVVEGSRVAVDSGFIVFNRENYPQFSAWLDDLGVPSQPTDMSFGVSNAGTGLEYGTASLGALFCRPGNLVSPRFLRMLGDLVRFYRDAPRFAADDTLTLGDLAAQQGYGAGLVEDHLLPMCGALWSLSWSDAQHISAAHVIAFMQQHRMLQLQGRPQWRVVSGGSSTYLKAFSNRFKGQLRVADPVIAVRRGTADVQVRAASGVYRFDAVVFACHSDQALSLLDDPSPQEQTILGAIDYHSNRVVVHSDVSVMPRSRAAWSSWNARVAGASSQGCQVTYWMNRLQGLPPTTPFFVTLNPNQPLSRVWAEREYAHPVFTKDARAAQARHAEINGARNTYYCGAYWGWGFHEDGFASAGLVADAFAGRWSHAA